jgi:ANTAR domain
MIAAIIPTRDPLVESIRSLALFAVQASGADGYAFFDVDADGALVLSHVSGPSIPTWGDLKPGRHVFYRDQLSVAAYSLQVEGELAGHLAFAFRGTAIDPRKLAILDRMAALIEAVEATHHTTAQLASRIGSLDAELAAIKIAERTQGLLANGAPDTDAIETVARHVETVLQGRQAGGALEELLRDLEDRVDERKLLVRAKAVLQRLHGMTEEQAYMQLRVKSRTSRKRLRVVAQELIIAASTHGCVSENGI